MPQTASYLQLYVLRLLAPGSSSDRSWDLVRSIRAKPQRGSIKTDAVKVFASRQSPLRKIVALCAKRVAHCLPSAVDRAGIANRNSWSDSTAAKRRRL